MNTNKIVEICGLIPINYSKKDLSSDNIIFQNDPNFNPINLYDFWGNLVTVNSFEECQHYVEGGWYIDKLTIIDIFQIVFLLLIISFLVYKFIALGYDKIFISKLDNRVLVPLFLTQNFFLYNYVKSKTLIIPQFIDEYISLASNVNFFKNLDFNAGDFIGGSYSVYLTSGPISAIGGVLGWNLTSNLMVARISNYYWIVLLQLMFSFLIIQLFNSDYKFLMFFNFLVMTLVPWWQGSLYMLGEIASTILFTNSIYLINKKRSFSMLMFSLSIFYGKLIILLPFLVFYITWIITKKDYKKIYKDVLFFSLPLLFWLGLINFNYSSGNLLQYFKDLYYLAVVHESLGLQSVSLMNLFNLNNLLATGEVQFWNNFDVIRVLVVPIVFIILIMKNREAIDKQFGKITIPISLSMFSIYLWFWLLSPTKWMRYSQHFSVVLIISLVYFINFNLFKSKLNLFIATVSLGIFIENVKMLIIIFTFSCVLIIFLQTRYNRFALSKFLLVSFLFIDILIPYFMKDNYGNLDYILEDCSKNIVSEDCFDSYNSFKGYFSK
tara:strand:- start:1008 stop:2660 length:1653 start_codon:yes stop_codon:yes gene_type:complete